MWANKANTTELKKIVNIQKLRRKEKEKRKQKRERAKVKVETESMSEGPRK